MSIILAIVITTLLGVLGMLLIEFSRPHDDNTAIFAILLGFLAPTLASMLDMAKTQQLHDKIDGLVTKSNTQEVKTQEVNDKVDTLVTKAGTNEDKLIDIVDKVDT